MSELNGTWTYRSLINSTDLKTDFNDLEFGRANLVIEVDDAGKITGTIGDTGWSLDIKGKETSIWINFIGKGLVNNEEWIYAYEGILLNPWPGITDQKIILVGSIKRLKDHGQAKAGVICSFYAVKN